LAKVNFKALKKVIMSIICALCYALSMRRQNYHPPFTDKMYLKEAKAINTQYNFEIFLISQLEEYILKKQIDERV